MNEEDCKDIGPIGICGVGATWIKPKYDFIFVGSDNKQKITGNSEALVLSIGDVEVLSFHADGKVFVRGEQVDSNPEVYKVFVEWMATMGLRIQK